MEQGNATQDRGGHGQDEKLQQDDQKGRENNRVRQTQESGKKGVSPSPSGVPNEG